MELHNMIVEMAKRASMDSFYDAAKKKYGANAVKDIKWTDVVALARELDVTIPAAAHKNKTGRGRVSLVPDDHADTKAPPKEEPKKVEPKKEEPKTVKKEVDLAHVANQVYSAFKNHPEGRHIYGTNRPEARNGGYMMDFRDWGAWENPDDAYDEEDYDWQVLTKKSSKALNDLCDSLSKQYGVKVDYQTSEKNWIEVTVK